MDVIKRAGAADAASADVIAWRRQQLSTAGFDAGLAAEVASDRRWDLHQLLELVESGCPPTVAARILAPLEIDE